MDRRTKATQHRDRARILNEQWKVGATQYRYNDDGHWYALLERFPAALFDPAGYLLFPTEEIYKTSPHIRRGKQISVPKPGISGVPGYILMLERMVTPLPDPDIHDAGEIEGRRKLVTHLRRERNRTLVERKKKQAVSLNCEACGFSFPEMYGDEAADYCEVHHLLQLSDIETVQRTRLRDLAILCANCHRVIHLSNPPLSLDALKKSIAASRAKT